IQKRIAELGLLEDSRQSFRRQSDRRMHHGIYISHSRHRRRRLFFAQQPCINFASVSIVECHCCSPIASVGYMLFRCGFAYFQKPFAAASMAGFGKTNQREYELIATFFAFPSPVAIHPHIGGKRPGLGFQNPRTLPPASSSSAGGAPNGSVRRSKVSRLPGASAEM